MQQKKILVLIVGIIVILGIVTFGVWQYNSGLQESDSDDFQNNSNIENENVDFNNDYQDGNLENGDINNNLESGDNPEGGSIDANTQSGDNVNTETNNTNINGEVDGNQNANTNINSGTNNTTNAGINNSTQNGNTNNNSQNNGNGGADATVTKVNDNLLFIQGGTYNMGSPNTEAQREADETQHRVRVSDLYVGAYEVTQKEYQEVMGNNPSQFKGDNLPVESVTWLEAVEFCNRLSEKNGLTPAYTIRNGNVTWNTAANGYRLPTEAEWEYVARAGTTTVFNTENSISASESNYYGHYPYLIEENYFSQGNLETRPGQYRQRTLDVGSFSANKWGLYDIHGNVREWCFDYYGEYNVNDTDNPTGPATGTLRITRGGGWNDYAKHMRSAYRSSMTPSQKMNNTGFRIVRNSENNTNGETIVNTNKVVNNQNNESGKILIAYFSWSGNTENAAEVIQEKIGADLVELELVEPYSSNYNRVLDEAQRDLNNNARPRLSTTVNNMDEYDVVMIGYPNWWATIPMPIATFLEQYDFSGKTIIPFCSHGGGSFGQSISDISKLAPNSKIGEGLSIHYSGGSSLSSDISTWLRTNGISER